MVGSRHDYPECLKDGVNIQLRVNERRNRARDTEKEWGKFRSEAGEMLELLQFLPLQLS
jgi:hypothetical protein